MKLKYYLRGLGIGIVVTAVIMSIAMKRPAEPLTDEQIKARATELGMVEDNFLSDKVEEIQSQTEEETAPKEQNSSEEMTSETETSSEEQVKTAEKQTLPTEEQTQKMEKQAQTEGQVQETDNREPSTVTMPEKISEITIGSGESSVSVSRKLEKAGLIVSAAEYDRYLCRNGYDKKICTGKHQIKAGATEEEIAQIITSR